MRIAILVIPALAVLALLGIGGLVLLIVGIARRSARMWISGLVGIGLAVLFLAGGLAVGFAGLLVERKPHYVATSGRIGHAEKGDYVRSGNGQATARIEGVLFTILAAAGSGSSSSTESSSGPRPGTTKARHEVQIGDVTLVVERQDARLTLSVNGTGYGTVHPGDSVVINEAREVVINGEPAAAGQAL